MADEYIRLDTTIIGIDSLINKAETAAEANELFKAKDVIYSQQRYTADVQPVKRGKWEWNEKPAFGNPYGSYICSECGAQADYKENYCCECGADMRGEDNG